MPNILCSVAQCAYTIPTLFYSMPTMCELNNRNTFPFSCQIKYHKDSNRIVGEASYRDGVEEVREKQ